LSSRRCPIYRIYHSLENIYLISVLDKIGHKGFQHDETQEILSRISTLSGVVEMALPRYCGLSRRDLPIGVQLGDEVDE
jgi:hypothetical protein